MDEICEAAPADCQTDVFAVRTRADLIRAARFYGAEIIEWQEVTEASVLLPPAFSDVCLSPKPDDRGLDNLCYTAYMGVDETTVSWVIDDKLYPICVGDRWCHLYGARISNYAGSPPTGVPPKESFPPIGQDKHHV